ncbi:hypothetical protein DNTS_010084 [Danionella cerebrum]|uniref:non-specific serine/threonine protein kinase n=1 Tax=Danionella cerebrum TaxID=2873325 RepID=A0A553N3N2_9TELE|nr:hypothetical protein DNTS_010084 [Danionella translucida]
MLRKPRKDFRRSGDPVAAPSPIPVAVPSPIPVSAPAPTPVSAPAPTPVLASAPASQPEPEPVPGPSGLQSSKNTVAAAGKPVSDYAACSGKVTDFYEFQELLVNGSFGTIYMAKHGWMEVAIKSGPRPASDSYIVVPDHPEPLYREVAMMVKLCRSPVCPNVIRMYEWFDGGDSLSMVLEYPQPCMSLKEFIDIENGLSANTARLIMRQLVNAVQHCISRGVFHNDINLRNILVNIDLIPKIKLIDFSSARLVDEDGYHSRTYDGDVHFQPPEAFVDGKYFPVPTNVWFLGIILATMSTGHLPFRRVKDIFIRPINGLESTLRRCQDLITKCLQRNPEDRPTLEEIILHRWMIFRPSWMFRRVLPKCCNPELEPVETLILVQFKGRRTYILTCDAIQCVDSNSNTRLSSLFLPVVCDSPQPHRSESLWILTVMTRSHRQYLEFTWYVELY